MTRAQAHPRHGDVVVFVDDDRWTGFDQLSAVLRRHGVRTVRITCEPLRPGRAAGALCYDVTVRLDRLEEGLDAALASARVPIERVLDLQCTELALASITPWIEGSALHESVREHLVWRARGLDKYAMSQRLADAGVPVPRALDAERTTPQTAAAELGLPVVLKPRLGYGGIGLRILHDVDADGLPSDLEREGGRYWEQFVPGQVVRYGACYRDGRILQEATFVSVRWSDASLGPATSVRTTDDDELLEIGRSTLRAVGGRGLANIECVQTAGGDLRVIDVNLRAWGSALTLGRAGTSFGEAYLGTLRARDTEPGTALRARAGSDLRVFPDSSVAVAVTNPLRAAALAAADLPHIVRAAGWRYALAGSLDVARAVGRGIRHDVGRRVRSTRSRAPIDGTAY